MCNLCAHVYSPFFIEDKQGIHNHNYSLDTTNIVQPGTNFSNRDRLEQGVYYQL